MTVIPGSAASFGVQFNASASYGTPSLTDQKLEFLDGAVVVRTDPVGLPVPVNGKITVSCAVAGLPQNKALEVRVVLVGIANQNTVSPDSLPFVFVSAPINIAAPIIVVA